MIKIHGEGLLQFFLRFYWNFSWCFRKTRQGNII